MREEDLIASKEHLGSSTSNDNSLDDKLQSELNSMPLRAKLEMLNELLVDTCIMNMRSGRMKLNDLGSIVTLLKNNKVVEEKREHSESDLIDSLVEPKK